MCTNIAETAQIAGWGRGVKGWMDLQQVHVSFDHPFHAPLEHAIAIDFTNEAEGLGARIAIEMMPESAKELIHALQTALARGEAEGVRA